MDRERDASIQKLLRESGHFQLSSGRHSDTFIDAFKVLESPAHTAAVAHHLTLQLDRPG